MNYADILQANSIVWPLTVLAIALFVLHKVEAQLSPIVIAMTRGVAGSAQARATDYAKAIMFGLSASLAAFYDVFSQMDVHSFDLMSLHQYMSLWAKIANPFIVAVLAYATQSDSSRIASNPPPTAP